MEDLELEAIDYLMLDEAEAHEIMDEAIADAAGDNEEDEEDEDE